MLEKNFILFVFRWRMDGEKFLRENLQSPSLA
jgi:hypothetical protein